MKNQQPQVEDDHEKAAVEKIVDSAIKVTIKHR